MKFIYNGILLQEVPNEISIGITILGCPNRCDGCHSKKYWKDNVDPDIGLHLDSSNMCTLLTNSVFPEHKDATCVCIFGGDWYAEELLEIVQGVKYRNDLLRYEYKYAWYVAKELNQLPRLAFDLFDYIKTGCYIKELGGLTSPNTNQRFYTRTFVDTTSSFIHN